MRNRFVRWLKGEAPRMVGVYSGPLGVCLSSYSDEMVPMVVYQPETRDSELPLWEASLARLEILTGVGRRQMSLSVALPSDDVFLRTISAPSSLTDAQLEQVAIVEAVSNLPVPPEEICLDFTRELSGASSNQNVRMAFCRRERVDEIEANSEEVRVPVWVVDRDIQAIHDAVTHLGKPGNKLSSSYPFGILLTERSLRLVICLGETDLDAYPLRSSEQGSLISENLPDQLANAWLRCRMSRVGLPERLTFLYITGKSTELDQSLLSAIDAKLCPAAFFSAQETIENQDDELMPPDEALLVALGMALRSLS